MNNFSGSIVCEEVTRQYPSSIRPAVEQVNLSIEAGELVVLFGPSGCGKTTLLKMINRLIEPTNGRILMGGQPIRNFPVNDLRRHIGYVIQHVGLFPHMTVAANIAVVPGLLGWNRQMIDRRVTYLIDLVGLPEPYLQRYPRQLSGGEQQRVGLARALAADPDILLMDEPFAALDAINRVRLQGELLEIQAKVHKTILFVTHDVEEAFRLAGKIAILNDGKLIQYGTPLEIMSQPKDQFVAQLIDTGNILRRLSLIKVQMLLDIKTSWDLNSHPGPSDLTLRPAGVEIQAEDDLRTVLSIMLATGVEEIEVTGRLQLPVHRVTLRDLQRLLDESSNEISIPSPKVSQK